MNLQPQKRVEFIDLAKGICIILVVFTHLNGNFYHLDYSLQIPLASFRMPLYFVLSGLFFKRYESFCGFLKRKTNKLLIPFFFFYLIFSFGLPNLMNLFGWGDIRHADKLGLLSIFNFIFYDEFSNGPIWFLLCLFIVNIYFYILNILADRFFCCNKALFLSVASICFGVLGYTLSVFKANVYLYLDTALTATPFFCFGFLLKKYSNILQPNKYDRYLWILVFICILCVWIFSGHVSFVSNRFETNSFFNIYSSGIFGTLMTLFIAKFFQKLPLISYWGRYSIIILCLHMPLLNIISRIINKTMPFDPWIQLFVTLLVTMLLFLLIIPIMKRFFPYVTAQKDLIHA